MLVVQAVYLSSFKINCTSPTLANNVGSVKDPIEVSNDGVNWDNGWSIPANASIVWPAGSSANGGVPTDYRPVDVPANISIGLFNAGYYPDFTTMFLDFVNTINSG